MSKPVARSVKETAARKRAQPMRPADPLDLYKANRQFAKTAEPARAVRSLPNL